MQWYRRCNGIADIMLCIQYSNEKKTYAGFSLSSFNNETVYTRFICMYKTADHSTTNSCALHGHFLKRRFPQYSHGSATYTYVHNMNAIQHMHVFIQGQQRPSFQL